MVRFSFSPGGKSRKDRIEQAKKDSEAEKSRRRNFGFLKNSDKRMSTTTLNRTREHAKQLAMVYADPVETPTSQSSGQGLLNAHEDKPFDSFNTNNALLSPAEDHFSFSTKRTVTNGSTSLLDQFVAPPQQERAPTTSTQDSFETASVGSAFDMGFLPTTTNNSFASPSSSTRRSKKKGARQSLDQFVEKTRSPGQGPMSYSGNSFDPSRGERSVISMPTVPSNSSMQASFAKQTTPASVSASGAAARRRFRNQMKHSSNSSVTSSVADDASYYSGTSTPPESPASSTRNMTGSVGKNRVAAYQRPQSGSFYSQASSTANSSQQSSSQQSGSDVNLFDSDNLDGGFTFDAFGLDQSQVEREVNDALQALAGQGMSGFSVFVNNDSDSNSNSEFPMENWDSPANSRRSSPAPSDSDQEGFVDGFRVEENTPVRHTHTAYSNTSPISSERSLSSPAGRRLIRAQARESHTPPRWEDAKKQSPKDVFGAPVSNPWKEDPWGSGDEDKDFSDSSFGGTKSEIQTSAFAAQPRFAAKASETKSDIGISTAYRKSVSFHKDVRSPRHKASPRHADEDESSEDSEAMQEELAREYAQEFVQRISPRHAQSMPQQNYHNYGEPPQSSYDESFGQPFDQEHSYQAEQAPFEDSVQEEMFQAEFGTQGPASGYSEEQTRFGAYEAASDYDSPQQEQNYDNEFVAAPFDQQDYGPSPSNVRNQQQQQSHRETEGRFGSVRSKYELSRGSSASSFEGADDNEGLNGNRQESSYEYGNLRNSYAAAKSRTITQAEKSATTNLQAPWKNSQTATSSSSNGSNYKGDEETPSDNSSSRAEEKKSEDDPSPAPLKTGSLKSKWQQWESKSTTSATPVPAPAPQTVPKWKRPGQVPLHSALSGVEMLTPDIVEARRLEKRKTRAEELRRASQEPISPAMLKNPSNYEKAPPASQQRADECQGERTSFASLRERLRSTPSGAKAKSDVGTNQRSSIASNVVDRLRRESPTAGSISDSKSDTGSSPSFLAGVKLRNTGSDVLSRQESLDQRSDAVAQSPRTSSSPMSSAERSNVSQSMQQDVGTVQPEAPAERKLTYRERRELELKKEQEEKSKLANVPKKEESKVDVAALIRKRIAANKQRNSVAENANSMGSDQVSQFRNSLKPLETSAKSTPSEDRDFQSPGANQPSPTHAHEQPRPPPRFESSARRSPRFSQGSSPAHTAQGYPDDEQPDSALLDNLSPASGGTNLTYSTDNSQPRDDLLSPKASVRQPSPRASASPKQGEERFTSSNRLEALLSTPAPPVPKPVNHRDFEPPEDGAAGKNDVKAMLSGFLGARNNPLASIPAPKQEDDAHAIMYARSHESPEKKGNSVSSPPPPPPPGSMSNGKNLALKDDPKYERYFRMLKVGMPMEVVKHAMIKDGCDPTIMDGDHNKPAGLPLKDDPKYTKYFKMLKMGISMPQVKHAMERDGLVSEVMDQDHNLPASASEQMSKGEPKSKDTHRRARLHWKTLGKIARNSLWSKIEKEPAVTEIDFDEDEFKELFQADITSSVGTSKGIGAARKKGAAVRVIDAKRANNGGIILARVRMSHDEMADAVDRIDGDALTAEQIENIIEFLPTKEERTQLEKYMLGGGQDAAEKFDGLCECEKFMVSMMTVKHAKRKVNALLFKLQFISCLQSIAEDAQLIGDACDELQHSTRLRQLLGIVLQFGNRLNTAGKSKQKQAGAFTLDSLLKLSQAKAFDKKTTFLHYLVMIVQRNNEILLSFTDDLPTVMKADKVYWDQCLQDLEEVENQLENVRRISLHEAKIKKQRRQHSNKQDDDDSLGDIELTLEEEVESLRSTPTGLFTLSAIKQVSALRDKVEATRNSFSRSLEYFGEDKDSMQPHELFNIFCSFGRDFNKAKDEAFANMKKKAREERKRSGIYQTQNAMRGRPPSVPERTTLKASSLQPHMNKVINDFKSPPKPNTQRRKNESASTAHNEALRSRPQEGGSGPRHPRGNDRNERRSAPQDLGHQRTHGDGHYQYTDDSNRNRQQASPPIQNAYGDLPSRPDISEVPVPRGMQESGRFEDAATPLYSHSKPQSVPSRESSAADSLRQKARNRRQRQMQIVSGRSTPVVSNASIPESRSPRSSPSAIEESGNPADSQDSQSSTHSRSSLSMRHRRLQAMKRVNASRSTVSSPQ